MKKGFTLIELLTTLVVIGVIALITVPFLYQGLKTSKEQLYNKQIDGLLQAGKNWGVKNPNELPKNDGETLFLSPTDLAKAGYIDAEEILDPRDNKQIEGCVVIVNNNGKYDYNYEETNCNNVKGEYLIKFDDSLNLKEKVEVNSIYTEQNVIAKDSSGNNLSVTGPTIKKSGTNTTVTYVDTSKVGNKYDLIYKATDGNGNSKELKIEVTIVDTIAPEIVVQGKNQNFTYYYATRDNDFEIPEAIVTDNSGEVKQFDGKDYKVTSNVSHFVGTYKIIYEAEDKSGNKRKLTVTVVIENTDLPIIKEVTGNATEWQNKDVTLKINKVSSKTKIKEYSFDDGATWQESNKKTFDKNQTVKMKVKDQDGNVSLTYEVGITKIDKEPPSKPVITLHKTNVGGVVIASGTWVNTDVLQEQYATDDASGIDKYERSIDLKTWKAMDKNAVETKEQEQNYYVRVRDKAGNISEVSEVYVIRIDKTAPVCVSSGGNSSWINYNWTIYGTCSDPNGEFRSGCKANVSHTQTGEINTSTASPGTVYDIAGNSTKCPSNQHLHIDKTAPSCSVSFSGTTGLNGWYRSNVTVSLNRQDNGSVQSGISNFGLTTGGLTYNGSGSSSQGETAGTRWNGYVKDRAGNTNSCSNTVKVDKTAPTITVSIGKGSQQTASDGSKCYSSVRIDPNCSDSLSGFYRYTTGNGNAAYLSVGKSKTRSVTCQDQAGNSTSKTYGTYNVCTKSKHSSCGYATCRTSACGCESLKCDGYNENSLLCGCARWGSTQEKWISNNIDGHTYSTANCDGVKHSPTKWKVSVGNTVRTREVYRCSKLQTSTVTAFGFFTYKQTQNCIKANTCVLAGCKSFSCTQFYSCKNKACGYATCYHY